KGIGHKEFKYSKELNCQIPKEWEVVKLGEISIVDTGGYAPQGEKYFKNGRYPFVRVQHLENATVFVEKWDLINEEAIKEYNLKLFPKGTIIFPKSGASINLEKRAMLYVDSYLVSHLCAIIPNDKIIDTKFLFYFLRKIKFAKSSAGTTLPYLNIKNIVKFLIPLPPFPEQQKIAEILSTVDELLNLEQKRKEKLERIKKGLMNDLLTGRKRVYF
ncbi:MAG: restriction endonuclease subunit S, partial [candidate division WOR-3 bacterium]|nr:restriction endonuclease subunit S [candidate division WOR-3 bacterium]